MSGIYVRAILAGIFFGLWPLLMKKSGLGGNLSAVVFTGIAFLVILPFALHEGFQSLREAALPFVVAAGVCGAIGFMNFNGMITLTPKERLGSMIVIMVLTQITVPVIYEALVTGDYSPKKILGTIMAFAAAVLLATA